MGKEDNGVCEHTKSNWMHAMQRMDGKDQVFMRAQSYIALVIFHPYLCQCTTHQERGSTVQTHQE